MNPILNYERYMEIKVFVDINRLYGIKYMPKNNDAVILLDCICELAHDGLFPASARLNDLIVFVSQYPHAKKLTHYLDTLPEYVRSTHVAQTLSATIEHSIVLTCINTLVKKESIYYNWDGANVISKGYTENENGRYLTINIADFDLIIKKEMSRKKNMFEVNGSILQITEINQLIKIIKYAKYVKSLTIENINAAAYFLS